MLSIKSVYNWVMDRLAMIASIFVLPPLELIIGLLTGRHNTTPTHINEQLKCAKDHDIVTISKSGRLGLVKPSAEQENYFKRNVQPPMAHRALNGILLAIYECIKNPYLIQIDDKQVEDLLNQTYYSRLITDECIDLTYFGNLKASKQFSNHSIKANLIKKKSPTDPSQVLFSLCNIIIDGKTITPTDPEWRLAKIYLIAQLDTASLFTDHSVVHLQASYIAALARQHLSNCNVVHLFLKGHFGYDIALNETIMNILYKLSSPANAFAYDADAILAIMDQGFVIDSKKEKEKKPVPKTPFACMMDDAHEVIASHVNDFMVKNLKNRCLKDKEKEEIIVFLTAARKWISWVPCISAEPADDELCKVVQSVLTRFIFDSTFVSEMDHIITTADLGFYRSIFRVRLPFKDACKALQNKTLKDSMLFHRVDTFQRIVFRTVFDAGSYTPPLTDVQYDKSLVLTKDQFSNNLMKLADKYPIFKQHLNWIPATINI